MINAPDLRGSGDPVCLWSRRPCRRQRVLVRIRDSDRLAGDFAGLGYRLHVLASGAFAGRNVGDRNESVTRARTYISWFMALYGIVFGLVFSAASDVRDLFAVALSNAHVPIWLLALPFALTLICMLFIPIALEGDKEDSASGAPRGLFAFVIFSEKLILILLGHLVFRLISAWPGGTIS